MDFENDRISKLIFPDGIPGKTTKYSDSDLWLIQRNQRSTNYRQFEE